MAGGERRLYAALRAIPSVMLVEMVGSRKRSDKAGPCYKDLVAAGELLTGVWFFHPSPLEASYSVPF
jgi:hypothetical protein